MQVFRMQYSQFSLLISTRQSWQRVWVDWGTYQQSLQVCHIRAIKLECGMDPVPELGWISGHIWNKEWEPVGGELQEVTQRIKHGILNRRVSWWFSKSMEVEDQKIIFWLFPLIGIQGSPIMLTKIVWNFLKHDIIIDGMTPIARYQESFCVKKLPHLTWIQHKLYNLQVNLLITGVNAQC